MRCALAAIAALVLVPAAAASLPPIGSGVPVALRGVHTLHIARPHQRSQASCSAHARKSPGTIERKLAPVACEQPPRVKLLDAGLVIWFAP